MTKQATFGSLIEGFNAHLKGVIATPETKTASTDSAGRTETGAPIGKSDPEVTAALPNGGQMPGEPASTIADRGVVAEESLPDQPKGIPTQGLERKEVSPSTKLAAGSVDELVARLTGNLKLASEQKAQKPPTTAELEKAPEAPATAPDTREEKKVEAPTTGDNKLAADESAAPATEEPAAPTAEVQKEAAAPAADAPVLDIDELAQKTAEFLRYSELGYEISKSLFAQPEAEVKTAGYNPVSDLTEADLAALVDARSAELKTAGLTDEQITAQLELDGQAFAQAKQAELAIVNDTRDKIANFVFNAVDEIAREGALSIPQAEYVLAKLGFANPTRDAADELRQAVEQKIASLVAEGKTEAEIADILQKDAEADAAALEAAAAGGGMPEGGAPEVAPDPAAAGVDPAAAGGAPDEAQLSQVITQAIAELEQAVQSGQITEDQAVQMLEEAGLDVNALLQAAGGGAPDAGGLPPEAAPAGSEAPAGLPPSAPEGGESAEHEASESPAKKKSEEKSEDKGEDKGEDSKSEKKEESGESKSEEKSEGKDEEKSEKKEAADPAAVDPAAAGGAPGLENLPPEVQAILQQIDQLLQSGQITEDQAMQAVEALLSGGGAPAGDPSAAGAAGVPAGAAPAGAVA